MTPEVKEYDVIIVGAGPGGSAAALALKDAGLRVAILDKSEFPRNKVCGELMHRKTVQTLTSILPEFEQEFKANPHTLVMKSTRIYYKGRPVTYNWQNESYTCPRIHFDDFLLSLVKKKTTTDIYTGKAPDKISNHGDGIIITMKDNDVIYKARLVIGADGSNSTVAKQLANKVLDREHYLGAVRAYYEGVADLQPNRSEVFYNPKANLNPMWVFPVQGGMANVGFGLLASEIAQNKVNMKDAFYEFFKNSPELSEKFKDAKMVGPLEGFGVALGSGANVVSGDNFLLVGDAASLTNPISGTGMGNAVVSGKLAAEQAIECFKNNDFRKSFMTRYDNILKDVIINDLIKSHNYARRLSKIPFILDVGFWMMRFKRVKDWIQRMV